MIDFNSLKVLPVESHACKQWILRKHYAKRIPQIVFSFGLLRQRELIGIITFGRPPSLPLSESICGKEHKFEVYEFNRLCIDLPIEERKNVATWFCSRTIKLLPNGLILVSYADTNQGHIGYVYQALNWLYTGLGSANTEYILKDGTKKHSRWRKSYFGEIESKVRQNLNIGMYILPEQENRKKNFCHFLNGPFCLILKVIVKGTMIRQK